MSTTQKRIFDTERDVIVRAFGGEPVKLRARSTWGAAVEVVGDNPNVTAFFSVSDVFVFDESAYRLMRTAFNKKDVSRLDKLWGSLHKLVEMRFAKAS